MIKTLYDFVLLTWLPTVSHHWICLKDFSNAWYKKKNTHKYLHNLRKKGYLWVTSVSYPRGMKRYYYTITPKGKQALWLKLSSREKILLWIREWNTEK